MTSTVPFSVNPSISSSSFHFPPTPSSIKETSSTASSIYLKRQFSLPCFDSDSEIEEEEEQPKYICTSDIRSLPKHSIEIVLTSRTIPMKKETEVDSNPGKRMTRSRSALSNNSNHSFPLTQTFKQTRSTVISKKVESIIPVKSVPKEIVAVPLSVPVPVPVPVPVLTTVPVENDLEYFISLPDSMTPSLWFQAVKVAFHRSTPPTLSTLLLCRKSEYEIIESFWSSHLSIVPSKKKKSPSTISFVNGALYISGLPGTGKSALLFEFLNHHKQLTEMVSFLQINCMSLSNPKKMMKYLMDYFLASPKKSQPGSRQLNLEDSFVMDDDILMQSLQKLFLQRDRLSPKYCVLVLDEIDHLLSGTSEESSLLLKLFEWALTPNSNLLLIGAANSMDMIHRWIPMFESRKLLVPVQCHFLPYSVDQMLTILKERISISIKSKSEEMDGTKSNSDQKIKNTFHPAALELCSKKVASMGDFRKALDICRLTIDMAEKDYYDSLLLEMETPEWQLSTDATFNKENIDISKKPSELTLKPLPSVKYLVHLIHVQKAITANFGTAAVRSIIELNLQQQLLIIALAILQSEKVELVISRIYLKFTTLCECPTIKTVPFSRSECQDSLTVMEGRGLISIEGPTTPKTPKSQSNRNNNQWNDSNHVKRSPSTGKLNACVSRYKLRVTNDEIMKGTQHVPILSSLCLLHIK